jgi:hypothetical protein
VLSHNDSIQPNDSVQDYGDATGIFNIGTAVDRSSGTRSYARNYLEPGNVFVLTDASVTKIIFSPEKDSNGNVIATGVEVKGPQLVILAKREVILSAGRSTFLGLVPVALTEFIA